MTIEDWFNITHSVTHTHRHVRFVVFWFWRKSSFTFQSSVFYNSLLASFVYSSYTLLGNCLLIARLSSFQLYDAVYTLHFTYYDVYIDVPRYWIQCCWKSTHLRSTNRTDFCLIFSPISRINKMQFNRCRRYETRFYAMLVCSELYSSSIQNICSKIRRFSTIEWIGRASTISNFFYQNRVIIGHVYFQVFDLRFLRGHLLARIPRAATWCRNNWYSISFALFFAIKLTEKSQIFEQNSRPFCWTPPPSALNRNFISSFVRRESQRWVIFARI